MMLQQQQQQQQRHDHTNGTNNNLFFCLSIPEKKVSGYRLSSASSEILPDLNNEAVSNGLETSSAGEYSIPLLADAASLG